MMISLMAAMVLAAAPVSLEFDGPLKDGLKQLAQKSGLNLVVIGDFPEHVNLNLPNVNGEEALETIAQAYGLEVTRSGKAADGKMWVIRRATPVTPVVAAVAPVAPVAVTPATPGTPLVPLKNLGAAFDVRPLARLPSDVSTRVLAHLCARTCGAVPRRTVFVRLAAGQAQLEASLTRAENLASVGELAATLAHEVR